MTEDYKTVSTKRGMLTEINGIMFDQLSVEQLDIWAGTIIINDEDDTTAEGSQVSLSRLVRLMNKVAGSPQWNYLYAESFFSDNWVCDGKIVGAYFPWNVGWSDGELDLSKVPSLFFLECPFSNLTKIDFSKNPMLTAVNLIKNELAQLDFSHNPRLDYLDVTRNKLTQLVLSHNPLLTHLDAKNNKLTELNLSNSPILDELDIHDNKLVQLNLLDNPNLISLSTSFNPLKQLDLSNNPMLKYLVVGHNSLSQMDLSNNSKLTALDVSFNLLKQLDLSNNPMLTSLYADHNPLIGVRINGIMFDQLSVEQLQIWAETIIIEDGHRVGQSEVAIDEDGNEYIEVPLSALVKLMDHKFHDPKSETYDFITDWVVDGKILGAYFPQNISWREDHLDLSKVPSLISLSHCESWLVKLDLSQNPALMALRIEGGFVELLNLSNNPLLTHLDLQNNGLTQLDLSNNPQLTSLDVEDNELTQLDLTNNPMLTVLCLEETRLTHLDVSNNPMLKMIYAPRLTLSDLNLANNPKLTFLDLEHNELTKLDLSNNLKLTHLDISGNQLTQLDVSNNPMLDSLCASDNPLTQLRLANAIVLENSPNITIPDELTFDMVKGFFTVVLPEGKSHNEKSSMSEQKFHDMWQAATNHLILESENEPLQIFITAKHLISGKPAAHQIFLLGNQLFNVWIVDIEEPRKTAETNPKDFDLFLTESELMNAVPCMMPMVHNEQGWKPSMEELGLYDINKNCPLELYYYVGGEHIEMSDWEVHDFCIQMACKVLEKSGNVVSEICSDPNSIPSIWFYNTEDEFCYLIVGSAKYPASIAKLHPSTASFVSALKDTGSNFIGYFISVSACALEESFEGQALPLYRGQPMIINQDDIVPIEEKLATTSAYE